MRGGYPPIYTVILTQTCHHSLKPSSFPQTRHPELVSGSLLHLHNISSAQDMAFTTQKKAQPDRSGFFFFTHLHNSSPRDPEINSG